MGRLHHYWSVFRHASPEERGERVAKVVERWLRRSPRVRRLGLAPDEPRWLSLERALACPLHELPARMRGDDPARGPLHGALGERAAALAVRQPGHAARVLAQAREILEGRYDLLGSGPVRLADERGRIDWHRDFKSGVRWPAEVHHADQIVVRGDASDVKVPWELSRFQHLLLLGQAYRLAPHVEAREAAALGTRIAGVFREQIVDWIEANPRGVGIHWACPMEVAIRAANWSAALALLRPAPELDDAFLLRLARALWVHGLHIRRHLEVTPHRPPTNHYVANLAGLLAIACALPELRPARRWRAHAWTALQQEIERQVLADGVDYERSLPYHRLVAEMLLHAALTASAAGESVPPSYRGRLAAMLEFTAACTRPDGTVPQWGDNDDGRFLPLDGYAARAPHDHRHLLATGGAWLGDRALAAAAGGRDVEAIWLLGPDGAVVVESARPRATSRAFPASRCYVLCGDDLHAMVSCGPLGTAGEGGHSHNDLFAPCIWAGGVEWIGDPGTGVYSPDPALRNSLRSTAAHATLQLDAREQNPFGRGVDDLFRCEGRARPEVREWSADAGGARLVASHRGFGDPAAAWVHEREIVFCAERRLWRIGDLLWLERGAVSAGAVCVRFPLGPAISAERREEAAAWPVALAAHAGDWFDREPSAGAGRERVGFLLAAAERRFWVVLDLPADSRVVLADGPYSPRYGVVTTAPVIVASIPVSERVAVRSLAWSPGAADRR